MVGMGTMAHTLCDSTRIRGRSVYADDPQDWQNRSSFPGATRSRRAAVCRDVGRLVRGYCAAFVRLFSHDRKAGRNRESLVFDFARD